MMIFSSGDGAAYFWVLVPCGGAGGSSEKECVVVQAKLGKSFYNFLLIV